ncbi:MAG: tRNA (adenosine(37)-N6)-dimethylallyltransferase MiaA [Methyloligellaceae bacterium]
MTEHKAVLIAGPTASGKSSLALTIAETLGGVIINADSMQVYRELRVLTARPTVEDEGRVPHRLYGCVAGRDAYSAGRWLADCAEVLHDTQNRGFVPVIVGGTGLYFKVLFEGLSPMPDIPPDIRDYWRHKAAKLGGEQLHQILDARDPVMAARLRPSDPQRLTRALEVLDATGKSLGHWQTEPGEPLLDPKDAAKIVVAPPRDVLYDRIDLRVDRMLENGAIEEVKVLMALGLPEDLPIMRALGVGAFTRYLGGALPLGDAAERVKMESRRYAKRQLT